MTRRRLPRWRAPALRARWPFLARSDQGGLSDAPAMSHVHGHARGLSPGAPRALVAFAAGSTVITNPRGHHEPVRDHVGVGSAANGAFLQVGGALGVAIIGSLLNTRYQDTMSAALAPFHVPHSVMGPVLGSIGGALGVAGHVGGFLGAELAHVSKTALSAEWTSA